MAEKLRTFDWSKSSNLTTSKDKANYPWAEWFDGDIWKLTVDDDFSTHPLMMERIIRTRATGRGAKVQVRHLPYNGAEFGVIVVQRTDIPGPAEQKKAEAAAKRAAKKAAAQADAQEMLAKAGIRPAQEAPRPSKRVAKPVAA